MPQLRDRRKFHESWKNRQVWTIIFIRSWSRIADFRQQNEITHRMARPEAGISLTGRFELASKPCRRRIVTRWWRRRLRRQYGNVHSCH